MSSLVVLNVEGERILARYTAKDLFGTFDVERKFESELLKKSHTIPDLEESMFESFWLLRVLRNN